MEAHIWDFSVNHLFYNCLLWAGGYFQLLQVTRLTTSPPPSCCINNDKSGFTSCYRGRLETITGFLLLRTETLWFSVSIFTEINTHCTPFLTCSLRVAADLVEKKRRAINGNISTRLYFELKYYLIASHVIWRLQSLVTIELNVKPHIRLFPSYRSAEEQPHLCAVWFFVVFFHKNSLCFHIVDSYVTKPCITANLSFKQHHFPI